MCDLLEFTFISGIDHSLRSIEINLYTTVLCLAFCRRVVSYWISLTKACAALDLVVCDTERVELRLYSVSTLL